MSKMSALYLEAQQEIINSKNANYDAECNYCVSHYRDSMAPSHYASSRCESGGHDHCTCDICF
jgi:hypothetical protein